MKRKNQRISDLFYNNRFLLVFSVVVAVIAWLVVAVEFSPEIETVVKGVPIEYDYKQPEKFGLTPFGEYEKSINVTIKGKRIVVDSDSIKDQIVVKAQTSYVTGVGTYSLRLDVSTKNNTADFEIIAAQTDEVIVYFDYYTEKEFVVDVDIDISKEYLSTDYYVPEKEDYIFPETNTVKISGPASEINKIGKVVAKGEIDKKLDKSITVDAVAEIVTTDGNPLQYTTVPTGRIPVTIPVYKIVDLQTKCSFVNTPSNYIDSLPFSVTVTPSTVNVGIPESKLDGTNSLEIASIDFSKLHSGENTFEISSDEISGCVFLDGTQKFTVVVDTGEMKALAVDASESSVTMSGKPEDMAAQLVSIDFSKVTLIGPASSIEQIDASSLVITADLSDVEPEHKGEVKVPARVTTNDCWSFGEYFVTLYIS